METHNDVHRRSVSGVTGYNHASIRQHIFNKLHDCTVIIKIIMIIIIIM